MYTDEARKKLIEESMADIGVLGNCFWEEYQRTGEYRYMLRWLKHRAYCYAVARTVVGRFAEVCEVCTSIPGGDQ